MELVQLVLCSLELVTGVPLRTRGVRMGLAFAGLTQSGRGGPGRLQVRAVGSILSAIGGNTLGR